jgi:hypothetical protein
MNRFLIIAVAMAATAAPALASTFWPGTVTNVPDWDTLNVRKWPAASSRVIDEYDNGERVSLTGRCKNTATNASFWIDGPESSNWKFRRMSRSNVWCQVVTGAGSVGWVRGKYVWPE